MIGTFFKRTERFLSKNWFNPFLTFYLNLRSFPFGTAIKFPIFVYGRPKIWNTTGEIIIESTITSGMITLNKMDPWAPSLMTVLSDGHPNIGNLRETFFYSQTRVRNDVVSSKDSDFVIDRYTFEVGGKKKGHRQIENIENGYLVKDDIEFGFGNVIPLWLFGLNY